jgi:hypothetical protein
MWRFITLAAALSLLFGCQAGGVRSTAGAPYDLNLVGAQLLIEQPLTVPAGQARVFLQDGGVVGERGLGRGRYDLYRPHCALEIDSVDHNGHTVPPGSFQITRVERNIVSVVRWEGVQLAATSLAFNPWSGRADRYHDGYHFWLAADRPTEVRRLSCYGVYARPPDLYPPTLDEINRALGAAGAIRGPVPGEW